MSEDGFIIYDNLLTILLKRMNINDFLKFPLDWFLKNQ